MNWTYLRPCAWVDTRARFVAGTPPGGALLDLGSSDGETLGHIAELRPDLRLFAADLAGTPENYSRRLPIPTGGFGARPAALGGGFDGRHHLHALWSSICAI